MSRKSKQTEANKVILDGLIRQFDALVTALCDLCCVSNYYKGQRAALVTAMEKLSNEQVQGIAGITIRYDVTGDYEDEKRSESASGGLKDLNILADTVVLTVFSTSEEDSDKIDSIVWDGHLKHELRGFLPPK